MKEGSLRDIITPELVVFTLWFFITMIDIIEKHHWYQRFSRWLFKEILNTRLDMEVILKMLILLAVSSLILGKVVWCE